MNLDSNEVSDESSPGSSAQSAQTDPRLEKEFAEFQRDPDVADRALSLDGPVTKERILALRELKKTRELCQLVGLINVHTDGTKPAFTE